MPIDKAPHYKLQWAALVLAIVSPVAVLTFLLNLEARLTRLETTTGFIAASISDGILPGADRRLSVAEDQIRRLQGFHRNRFDEGN